MRCKRNTIALRRRAWRRSHPPPAAVDRGQAQAERADGRRHVQARGPGPRGQEADGHTSVVRRQSVRKGGKCSTPETVAALRTGIGPAALAARGAARMPNPRMSKK